MFGRLYDGGGAEAPWSPQKWHPSLRICRITSRPRKTGLTPSVTSPSLPPFCLHAPHFGSNKKIFGFYFHQEPFFKNSQHDEIVQNDTLTFCINKWILIEIKGLNFVFLNFTNSLNCEELLQFSIKIEKCSIILEGSHVPIKQYQRQFTKKGSFCEILVFVILSYALENIEELFFLNWNKELK